MSDIPSLLAIVGETRGELGSLAQSMAALMADPNTRSADRRVPTMGRRMGVVTAVSNLPTVPLTASVEINGTVIPGCSPQSTYRPMVGDLVWLEFLGADPHISPPLTTDANRKWNALSLGSGWSQAAGYLPPSYWRDPLGIVHLRGTVGGGANGSVLGTLPANNRPPDDCAFVPYCAAAGIQNIAALNIDPNGAIVYGGPGAPTHVSLDGITFRID